MSATRCEIRPGAYADSIVLMQLQSALSQLPGVLDAGVVMGTPANLELLRASDLYRGEAAAVGPDDLVLVVKAEDDAAAAEALARVDELLARRRSGAEEELRSRSLSAALKLLPEARWVAISVPGRYAAGVAREALELGRHVFLYSDNVSLAEEVALKTRAADSGLLVMGPDCGTAIIQGVGLGFANRVRRGRIGLVGASGTGLQSITSRLHALGAGVSHALGTGGRDLAVEVGAVTARQGLDLLARDPDTQVVVLVSKPPAPEVATPLLAAARSTGKPVVVYFLGTPLPIRRLGNLHFAGSLEAAARQAAALLEDGVAPEERRDELRSETGGQFLRGLFAGGTLALEAVQTLQAFLTPVHSNLSAAGATPLPDPARSLGHTVLDLGADELTVGRLHPMIDQELRLRRLKQEAKDPEVGLILLDLVLGHGSHPDPAAELAPAIREILEERPLDVVALLVGTDEDPQDLAAQRERLSEAGARVVSTLQEAIEIAVARLSPPAEPVACPVDLAALAGPVAVVNVGLESFYDSLLAQGAQGVQVDWRPPAGGDEGLLALLEKMGS